MREVFLVFLKLGLTSFGGPIAHLGYFRRELIERREWISESQFAQLIAISQFLPGPASSQLGFALGLVRAGWAGAVSAFIAFTAPSAVLLLAFAALLPHISGTLGEAAIHGLKLVALSVVAHGVLGMARRLCPDFPRMMIAAAAVVMVLAAQQAWAQLVVVAFGSLAGMVFCGKARTAPEGGIHVNVDRRTGAVLLALFALLLIGLPLAARESSGLVPVAAAFYRAGALAFGGGHVVLPLLEETVVAPGWVPHDEFLAGYGAAQAVPGPMFSFAAYLGALLPGSQGGFTGASIAIAAIFLPGFLLMAGVLPFWQAIAGRPTAARAIAGINAAVVGILGAALYDPVWINAVRGPLDVVIAIIGFALLAWRKLSAIFVVLWCIAASVIAALF